MKYKNGEDFLNKLFQNLHLSPSVMRTALKSETPEEKISKYLERLELIRINKSTITAITTGIFAIKMLLAIVRKDLFFFFLKA